MTRGKRKAPPAETPADQPEAAPIIPGMGAVGDVAATWMPIDFVQRWDRNPRINAHVVDGVAASILAFGFGAPLICRSSGVLIAGDTRIQAAHKLKMGAVPVRVMDHLSDNEADALAIADNKWSEKAQWNDPSLTQLVRSLESKLPKHVMSDAIGFGKFELSKLLGRLNAMPDPDKIPGSKYREQFGVIVVCADAKEQEAIYTRLHAEGLSVRVVVT